MFRKTSRLLRPTIVAAITLLALLWFAIAPQSASQSNVQNAAIAAQPQSTNPLMINPVVWSVLAAPIYPVKGSDGRIHLIYELNVTNASRYDVRLTTVEVLDELEKPIKGTSKVVSIDGKDITGKLRLYSQPQRTTTSADFSDQLSPGQSGVIYFDVVFGEPRDVPNSLKHRITTSLPQPFAATVIDSGTEVSRQQAVVIAPPLKGDNWLAENGSGAIIAPHRYTVQPTNARLRSPESFAIDFVQLDAQKRLYVGDIANLNNWPGYGADIVSVAPGRIVEVLDNLNNQIPGQPIPALKPDEYPGNYVIVDIGDGKYVSYGHMLPGSIAVREGDTVQQGQVLGKLGTSGNSDGPHLHFQITDSDSFLNTNGLPFVFDQMTYQGQATGTFDFVDKTMMSGEVLAIDTQNAGEQSSQMPLSLDLVQFR